MSMPDDYRGKFIAQLHNALSGFTGTDVDEAVRYFLNNHGSLNLALTLCAQLL
jgi:hypothetical protein